MSRSGGLLGLLEHMEDLLSNPNQLVASITHAAHVHVQTNYPGRWSHRSRGGTGSFWQTLKERMGWEGAPGLLSGSTFNGIQYRVDGNVGTVYLEGKWPVSGANMHPDKPQVHGVSDDMIATVRDMEFMADFASFGVSFKGFKGMSRRHEYIMTSDVGLDYAYDSSKGSRRNVSYFYVPPQELSNIEYNVNVMSKKSTARKSDRKSFKGPIVEANRPARSGSESYDFLYMTERWCNGITDALGDMLMGFHQEKVTEEAAFTSAPKPAQASPPVAVGPLRASARESMSSYIKDQARIFSGMLYGGMSPEQIQSEFVYHLQNELWNMSTHKPELQEIYPHLIQGFALSTRDGIDEAQLLATASGQRVIDWSTIDRHMAGEIATMGMAGLRKFLQVAGFTELPKGLTSHRTVAEDGVIDITPSGFIRPR